MTKTKNKKTKTPKKPYTCNFCFKAFAIAQDLVKHVEDHIGDEDLINNDDIKKEEVKIQTDEDGDCLEQPIKIEPNITHGETPIKIEPESTFDEASETIELYCEMSMKVKKTDKNHENKDKYKICDICQKTFSSNGAMYYHKRKEHSDQELTCSYCPRKFKIKHHLKLHENVVHSNKSQEDLRSVCDQCLKSFKSEKRLEIHRQRSHGEKKYLCAYCAKGFCFEFQVNYHTKLVHQKMCSNDCQFCPESFNYDHQLINHISNDHKEYAQECLKEKIKMVDTDTGKCVSCGYVGVMKNLKYHLFFKKCSKEQ